MVISEKTQCFNILVYAMFEGGYVYGMPELIKAGFEPMNSSDVMEGRLRTLDLPREHPLWRKWWNNPYITSDGIAYFRDKRKIALDAQVLREISPDSNFSPDGGLILTPEQYNALEGEEFLIWDLKKAGFLADLSEEEAKEKPFWRILARSQDRLNDYVDAVFAQAEDIYHCEKNMRVWLARPQHTPVIYGLLIDSLFGSSDAYGNISLRDNKGTVIGYSPAVSSEERIMQAIKGGYPFMSGDYAYNSTRIRED